MAARKLQQEVDRCFKKVAEGVTAFEGIYDKIQSTTNAAQKEKLEDSLKKEIKKLQRSRDQIKAWAQQTDIKDKKPLLDHRKLIETQMEKFKAVEKEMKTKAYSKEGLSAASKLDPKEKEKIEAVEFLQSSIESLELQVEQGEAELEGLTATIKKGKKDTGKADRISELETRAERHKWHIKNLEMVLRSVENGAIEVDQVKDLEENIKYYVDNNQEVDFMEDEGIYDDLNLGEEEDMFGTANDIDRVSSQDAQSVQDEQPELEQRPSLTTTGKPKTSSGPDGASGARRPSTQLKSPLPALAALSTPLPTLSNGGAGSSMKPAPAPPIRAPGEGMKYASAAAAAAAGDKNGVGIAPLPPPPGANNTAGSGLVPLAAASGKRVSPAASPLTTISQPAHVRAQREAAHAGSVASTRSPALSHTSTVPTAADVGSVPVTPAMSKAERAEKSKAPVPEPFKDAGSATGQTADRALEARPAPTTNPQQPFTNGNAHEEDEEEEQSVYHLPSSLQDLLESFEATKADIAAVSKQSSDRMLAQSHMTFPESVDSERPRHYKPQNPYPYTPDHYPQEPLSIFDDPRLYQRIETDALFYAFYYRQGTYQQYLAAKALKQQSWRFHKQYQTWFQRHEEPKSITEDYEQGTYRFFDYESTWMNRRKADFKFVYKYLEDEL